jgi:glutathione S-transferase
VKLYYSGSSPFARKVRACAIAREIDGQIELVTVNPHVSPPALVAVNPLSLIPTLVTGDGLSLFGSQLICEYLDSIEDGTGLMFPRAGAARWRALKFQSLADGLMENAVAARGELGRPKEEARDAAIDRRYAKIDWTLAELERDHPHKALDIGSISVACALGYLDLRFDARAWRDSHPQLAAWAAAMAPLPALATTVPTA